MPWRPAACTSRPPRAAGENFAKTTFVLGKICLSTTSFPCSSATHDPSLLLRLYLAESSLMSSWVRLHAYVCACVSSSRVCCVFVLCVLGVCVNCRCVCTRVRECAHVCAHAHGAFACVCRRVVCRCLVCVLTVLSVCASCVACDKTIHSPTYSLLQYSRMCILYPH